MELPRSNVKWNNEQIKDEVSKIYKILGKFPNQTQIIEHHSFGLLGSILKNYETLYDLALEMGLPATKNKVITNRIKRTKENIKEKIMSLYKELGVFPSFSDVANHSGLISAIYKEYGSFHALAQEMGFQTKNKSKNYWRNFENVEKEILPLSYDGCMPTSRMISSGAPSGDCVIAAIHNYFGGIKLVAERLNLKYNHGFRCSDLHYVDSGNEYMVDEYLSSHGIIHEVRVKVPESNYLADFKIGDNYVEVWGYADHRDNKRCILYNKRRIEKERHYAKLGLNLISVEESVFRLKPNRMKEKFNELLSNAGIEVGDEIDSEDIIRDSLSKCRTWDKERILEDINKLVAKFGYFPEREETQTIPGLRDAMQRYGTSSYWRNQIDAPRKPNPNVKWNEELIIFDLKLTIEELGHFPTTSELTSMDKGGLRDIITQRGGINVYRRKLGFKPIMVDDGYWNEETVSQEVSKLTNKLGHFPTREEIEKEGMGILSAINRNGGLNFYRNKFNAKIIRSSKGHWTEETTIKELTKIKEEIGRFPLEKELSAMGRNDLINAVNKNGGWRYFREKMGVPQLRNKKQKIAYQTSVRTLLPSF